MKNDTSVRHMSARDLVRNFSEVLDDVERTGSKVIVLRYSRPAAMISPVGDAARLAEVRTVLAGHSESSGSNGAGESHRNEDEGPAVDDAEDLTSYDLQPNERTLLMLCDERYQHPDRLSDKLPLSSGAFALALVNLEMKRLLKEERGRYALTVEGARVQVALMSRDIEERPAR